MFIWCSENTFSPKKKLSWIKEEAGNREIWGGETKSSQANILYWKHTNYSYTLLNWWSMQVLSASPVCENKCLIYTWTTLERASINEYVKSLSIIHKYKNWSGPIMHDVQYTLKKNLVQAFICYVCIDWCRIHKRLIKMHTFQDIICLIKKSLKPYWQQDLLRNQAVLKLLSSSGATDLAKKWRKNQRKKKCCDCFCGKKTV